MKTSRRNTFTTIRTEGAILPPDLLQRVAEGSNLDGLQPTDYHLFSGEKLNEAINRSWNRLIGAWGNFKVAQEKVFEGQPGTTETRERWLLPLFQELGYGRLQTSTAYTIEGKSYPISHGWGQAPIHLLGFNINLSTRTAGVAGASRTSPHSMVQEFLNRSDDHLWAFLSNGLQLRILRDNVSLTRQAYVEFDLQAMMEGEVYADFVLLWLLCHQSRVEGEKPEGFWLEQWSRQAQEQGTRALDQLRAGVEEAISSLGSGFLKGNSPKLRADLRAGTLSKQDYYRQLLRMVYRLIFLFVAEDRELLFDPESDLAARRIYQNYYSTQRLRHLAERSRGLRHADLYHVLRVVMGSLASVEGSPELGLPALGGFLFSAAATQDLDSAELPNQQLLDAIRALAYTVDGKTLRAVDYKNLGPEELGSVYESLLELHPEMNVDAGLFSLTSASGNERKTTGSYYTPSSLIQVLLDSALDPVLADRLRSAGAGPEAREAAILDLKVCDPAVGSGHFLIAAAHRLARHLAVIRTGDDEPTPDATRAALRDVIRNCLYGVDLNPMAVELCKVSLWMEALEPGKPLSFLDDHIKHGNSLVGVGPGLDISEIPDKAFQAAFGDDKKTGTALRRRNKRERAGQIGIRWDVTVIKSQEDLARWMTHQSQKLEVMPEEAVADIQAKEAVYQALLNDPQYLAQRLEYDLWTAAFFWQIPEGDAETMLAPTQQELRRLRAEQPLDAELTRRVQEIAAKQNFFHWAFEFPSVFNRNSPGFDVILGNPPWEAEELIEKEFFSVSAPNIAEIATKAKRSALIDELSKENPGLYKLWLNEKHAFSARSNFFKQSENFKLGAKGKLNTYRLFAEHSSNSICSNGRNGLVLKSGIINAQDSQDLFGCWSKASRVVLAFDFINLRLIFPGVVPNERFCLLVLTGLDSKASVANYAFGLEQIEDIRDRTKIFNVTVSDLMKINPNDLSVPPSLSSKDYELLRHIHTMHPTLRSQDESWNPWGIHYTQGHINSASASKLFSDLTSENLLDKGASLDQNEHFRLEGQEFLPLYEGKFIGQVNHRFGTFEGVSIQNRFGTKAKPNYPSESQYANPSYEIKPRYWLKKKDALDVFDKKGTNFSWLFSFRDVCRAIVDARTVQACVLPQLPCVDGGPLLVFEDNPHSSAIAALFFNALWSSFILDYSARQKIHGAHLTKAIAYQLPIPTQKTLKEKFLASTVLDFVGPRSLELTYVTYSLDGFARDCKYQGPPFIWNSERRFLIRCELDAAFFHIYKINRDDVSYILETFQII
jgi:hypothetical protein